jgi:hypothetical protein
VVSPSGLVNRLIKLRDVTLMVHFTCDLCGKELTGSGESRYVVKIEAYPGFDPTAVAQILQRDEALVSEDLETSLPKAFRFDLCGSCHVKFVKDPLGKDAIRTFDFSKN